MARYKTRRRNRYEKLRLSGFLPFEARTLSRVPFRVPYIRSLMTVRRRMLRNALKEGMSRAGWERKIKTEYFDSGWLKWAKRKQAVYDPWKMLKDFERGYKARHPEYVSPWEKKQKNMPDFLEKIERTYEKNRPAPRGMRRSVERERDELNQRIVRAISGGDQKLRRELERERNRRFGY
jgi:hypothetical protein